MINYKYLISLSFICSFIQTIIYSLLLLLAYLFWTAPNAGLIIGTVLPFLIVLFFIFILIQNITMLVSKSDNVLVVFFIIDVLLVLPFITNFTWLSPFLILFNIFILYTPFEIRKRYFNKNRKQGIL